MWRDMESLVEQLDEAAGVTSAQAQLNKKRELEVGFSFFLLPVFPFPGGFSGGWMCYCVFLQ